MVLAEIPRRMEEFFGNDGRLQPDLGYPIKDGLAARALNFPFVMERVFECLVCGFQAGIATLEQLTHSRRYEGVSQAIESAFALYIAQIKGAGRIEINDSVVGCDCTNSRLLGGILKGYQAHGS